MVRYGQTPSQTSLTKKTMPTVRTVAIAAGGIRKTRIASSQIVVFAIVNSGSTAKSAFWTKTIQEIPLDNRVVYDASETTTSRMKYVANAAVTSLTATIAKDCAETVSVGVSPIALLSTDRTKESSANSRGSRNCP
jgi:hypothetical protein